MESNKKYYPEVNPNPDFPALEQEIIKKWKEEQTFERSLEGEEEFVFYDGPPFANGLPHYGHLLTGFKKDLFPRFQTMLGKKVTRRFGWDCHGLPAEMGAEKELGISGKVAIENFGIDKFNAHCRSSVMQYAHEWEAYVERQARWVDFKNDYKTMEMPYMESVIWAFKELYDKGLVYESMRVMPYSWACETPVSDFETRMDNSYREKVSKAVTVKFSLEGSPKGMPSGNYKLLVWTTTSWTLPSNLAIAVKEDVEYSCFEKDGEILIIATALALKYQSELGDKLVGTMMGSAMLEMKYAPLMPYFKDHPNSFRVLNGEFVTTEDGTGAVHMAPGFGEDDFNLCKANNIEVVCPVDNAGKFVFPIIEYQGMQVFDAADQITIRLKNEGKWLKTEQYIHNYPHCWRTDTPLIYKAVPSWYVAVTKIKDKMIANNQKINWIPSHIKDGMFGKWLENARDWSISRNRYWGCPLPIWKSDNPEFPHIEVYGSIAEIEEAFGVKVPDLHRPFIDELVKPNPKDPSGKSMLRRVTDVFDCWFESGSMPYGQVHYPFENKEWFETHFPADFITEYVGQTRGWFYTLLVLSTALFDKPPFLNVICHGVLLGSDGQKLSKRLKNYPDPNEVFDTIGADAMRWFLVSSPAVRGQDLIIDKDARGMKEALRTAIKPIWNAYNFFTLYANADEVQAKFDLSSVNILDKYILSKCFETVAAVKKSLLAFDSITACKAVEEFLEVLNNWYIRRSRERFWKSEKDQDKLSAYNTLYSVLVTISKAAAPMMPITLEAIYQGLTGNKANDSVHLQKFPDENYIVNHALIEQMERVRNACTAALFVRNEQGIRVRQPLSKVTFIGVSSNGFDDDLKQLVLDEINVKTWENLEKSDIEKYANYTLKINFPVLGKRLPQKVKDIISAQKLGNWSISGSALTVGGELLNHDEYQLLLEPKAEFKGKIAALPSNDALVLLDLNISDELKLEGIARDVVRAIQQARKDMNLNVADKIKVSYKADGEIQKAINLFDSYIKEQVLALEVANTDEAYETATEIEGFAFNFRINAI